MTVRHLEVGVKTKSPGARPKLDRVPAEQDNWTASVHSLSLSLPQHFSWSRKHCKFVHENFNSTYIYELQSVVVCREPSRAWRRNLLQFKFEILRKIWCVQINKPLCLLFPEIIVRLWKSNILLVNESFITIYAALIFWKGSCKYILRFSHNTSVQRRVIITRKASWVKYKFGFICLRPSIRSVNISWRSKKLRLKAVLWSLQIKWGNF